MLPNDFCSLAWKAHLTRAALVRTSMALHLAICELRRAEEMLERVRELEDESVDLTDQLHKRRRHACDCPNRQRRSA